MRLELNLAKPGGRLAFAVGAFASGLLLAVVIVSRFVIGTLADYRIPLTSDTLRVPVDYFPGSARLNARLASAELSESDRELWRAESHAQRAVNLSPFDYRFRLTLATIKETGGDRAAAEELLKSASALAPNYWSVHYRLGNLLVREDKLEQAIDEFRIAVNINPELLGGTFDLVWRASRENVDAVQAVGGNDSKTRFALAQFLIKVSRPAEAATIFSSIDRADRRSSTRESSSFLDSLIAAGKLETARELFSDLIGSGRQPAPIWNGGFESDIAMDFAQFEWSLGRTEYARLAIDETVAHTGSRSLRVDFIGQDTTRLDNEVKQMVPLRPGARYKLECYVRTNGLETPEGPRVVVTDRAAVWIAASEPVAQGSSDWQQITVDFVAPQSPSGASAVFVSIKRKPRFSYDEPTRGTVWFDDFSIRDSSN